MDFHRLAILIGYWLLFDENRWKVTESCFIDCSSISNIKQLLLLIDFDWYRFWSIDKFTDCVRRPKEQDKGTRQRNKTKEQDKGTQDKGTQDKGTQDKGTRQRNKTKEQYKGTIQRSETKERDKGRRQRKKTKEQTGAFFPETLSSSLAFKITAHLRNSQNCRNRRRAPSIFDFRF